MVAGAGCSYPTDVTPYPGLCPPMYVAAWSPPGKAAGVPIDVILAVTFSDYPDPDTVGEPSMLLTTGVFRVPETYRVDLADKAVTMTPAGWLGTNLGYTVTVMPSIASLAGCSGPGGERQFTTGDGPAPPPFPPSRRWPTCKRSSAPGAPAAATPTPPAVA